MIIKLLCGSSVITSSSGKSLNKIKLSSNSSEERSNRRHLCKELLWQYCIGEEQKLNCWVFVWETFWSEVRAGFGFFFLKHDLASLCLWMVFEDSSVYLIAFCVAVAEKQECTWLVSGERRDVCFEIHCNSVIFWGTVEPLISFTLYRFYRRAELLYVCLKKTTKKTNAMKSDLNALIKSMTLHYV